jgi:hypothetical protein
MRYWAFRATLLTSIGIPAQVDDISDEYFVLCASFAECLCAPWGEGGVISVINRNSIVRYVMT